MDKELIKRISFFASAGMAFVVGLLFILLGDWGLKSGSPWLIGGMLLTFGSAACVILSDMFKERQIVFWVMKGLALALIVAFVGYLVGFHNGMAEYYATKPNMRAMNDSVFIALMVLGCVSVAIEIADVVLSATIKED